MPAAVHSGGHPSFDVDASASADAGLRGIASTAVLPDRELALPALVLGGVAAWCAMVMWLGLSFADSLWDGLWIAAFGVQVPLILLRHATRFLEACQRACAAGRRTSARDETLDLLLRYGYLTPTMAATRGSLTLDEATVELADLAQSGHARVKDREGGPLDVPIDDEPRRHDAERARTPVQDEGIEPESCNKPRLAADRESEDVQMRAEEATPLAGAEVPVEAGHRALCTARPGLSGPSIIEALSERELEVLALLASGRSNREIARELVVAIGTVKTHTNNLYRKLSARNRAEALAVARELSLV